MLPAVTEAGADLVTERSDVGAVAVAVKQAENSEVLPAESVAVAVIVCPAVNGDDEVKLNEPPPITVVEVRKVLPCP